MREFYELRKQVLNGPRTRVGEITYSKFEVDDVAKSILPLTAVAATGGPGGPWPPHFLLR